MRAFMLTFATVTLAAIAFTGADAGEGKKNIKPTRTYGGKVGDEKKKIAAPKSGYLTTQDALEKLWQAWDVKGKAPKIDFAKQIVFVNMSSGPNSIGTSYSLDEKGDLTSISRQTLIAGPGFGYGIDVLPRKGIKTYRGVEIK